MAILTGFNIGANEKGILNLGSTINTPLSATLQSVTDGMGVASPLQLSTAQVGVSTNLLVGDSTGGNAFITTEGNAGVFNSLYRYSNNVTRARYEIYKSRGTKLSPLVITTGDELGSLDFYGYDGTAFQRNVILLATANNVTGSTITSRFSIGLGVSAGANDYIASWTSLGMILSANATSITPSARLHVRGDGTNPVARFEDNTGGVVLRIDNSLLRFGGSAAFGSLAYAMTGTTFSGNNNGTGLGFYSQFSIAGTTDRFDFGFSGDAVANTAGTVSHLALVRTFAAGAGTANFRPLNIAYTINNSGAQTGTATGIFLNATETALNGMTHNLMDLQVGGVSQFRVSRTGLTTANGFQSLNYNESFQRVGFNNGANFNVLSYIRSSAAGVIILLDNTEATFNRLNFGGTTNAFPAIARQGSTANAIICSADTTANTSLGIGMASTTALNGSAIFQADSTTKGILFPRMTTTQVNLIATPAEGLVVFNTTISHLCVYQGGAWVRINHSPM